MDFEEDEIYQNKDGDEVAAELKKEEINGLETIRFSCIVNLLNKLSQLRGRKKGDYLRNFLKILFKSNRKPEFTYSIMRLLLPAEDRERGNYGIKEKNLAIIARECFNLSKDQYERLKHFKNPNYHPNGTGIGDFAICLHDVVKGVCEKSSTLTVRRLNQILDKLVTADGSAVQIPVFREFHRTSTAEEIKWISRIILKDLKLNIKMQSVLNTFHPDGNDYYNLTNSIKETCKKLENIQTSLNDDIALFHPIRPMLAGKKNMKYFQQTSGQNQYIVETKFDGERLQAHISGDKIKVFSRNGVDYNNVYEKMIPIIKDNVNCDACILDGEIIVLEKQTKAMVPFGLNKVVAMSQDSDMQLCYKVFDLLWIKKRDQEINLMSYALEERKNLLQIAMNQVPGFFEIVKFERISKAEEIQKAFQQSMERNEEGIMLKDPASAYLPKERAINWIKMKGDYMQGLTDTLDLIILAGYFGSCSYRVGPGAHWTDKITTFLLGVIEKIDPDNPRVAYAIPFCKVGTGYTGDELEQLRAQLRRNLILNDTNRKPSYMSGNWKPKLEDRPDCYINKLQNSRILEIKGAELINSDAFGVPVTLRFPRVVKIRYDKDWNEAMKLEDITNMQNSEKYTKNIRRRRGSDQQQQKNNEAPDQTKKRQKLDKIRRKNNQISEQLQCVSLGEQKLKSHLFSDMQFYVFQLEKSRESKHDVERAILLNSGKVVQNPIITTQYVVADRIDFKLILLERNQRQSFTFIKPQYIFNCIQSEMLIPLSPIYLTILPQDKKEYYLRNYDQFGDSYTSYLNRRELDEILKEMDNQKANFKADHRLQSAITVKNRRFGRISLAFNLNQLEIIKLKMLGNRFVESFAQFPNSIIVGRDVTAEIISNVNQYKNSHRHVIVEDLQTLYNDYIF